MNFNIRQLFKKTDKTEQRSLSEYVDTHLAFQNGLKGYVSREASLKLSAVYRCVELISNAVAQLKIYPYRIDRDGQKKLYKEHATFKVLFNPNRRMTWFTFIKLLITDLLLNGNAYAYIKRNDNQQIEELIYIPSNYVLILTPETDFLSDVRYNILGFERVVEHTEIIHLVNVSSDGVHGISTLRYASQTLNLAERSENYAYEFFESAGNLSGFISSSVPLTTQQKKDIKRSWSDTFKSGSDGKGIAVLEGNLDFKPIQINSKDAQLLESRGFDVISIARYFGVPSSLLFSKEGTSYNSQEAENLSFLTHSISPLLQKIEQELEKKLFLDNERTDIDIVFDLTNLLRADLKTKSEYYAKLFGIGVYSQNEIRKELDLPSIEFGDGHYTQVNMMTLKQFSESDNVKVHTNNANNNKNLLID